MGSASLADLDRQTLVFDADDTLWENNVLFQRVVADYVAWMAHPTLDHVAIQALLDDVERANIVTHGYGSASFLRSLRECFERLQERPATEAEAAEIARLGARLARGEVELIPDVAETLAELGTRHDLLLLTKGQHDEQQRKIDASNLAHHFRSLHIVAEKRAPTYRALSAERDLDPSRTWMIGNSPRSDIVAARQAGWRAVFIPNVHTWVHEEEEIDPADGGVLHLRTFRDLVQHF